MECIEAIALKSSCFSRFSMWSYTPSSSNCPPQLFDDDPWCSADDFSVDEFFDLPTTEGGGGGPEGRLVEEDEDEAKDSSTLSLSPLDDGPSNFSTSSSVMSASLPAQDLTFQVEDMEELELWSHLMDDSVLESSSSSSLLAYPLSRTGMHLPNRFQPATRNTPCIPAAFPVRPRSRLLRKSRLQVRPIPNDSSSAAMGGVMFMKPFHDWDSLLYLTERTQKKQRKEKKADGGGGGELQQRRCSHCLAQKTPQWRAGPLGRKTLCNACGVRFKKGRLYPEYRPACSPTFSMGIHSNSHRKVMEMRREKEMTTLVAGG